MIDQYAVEKLGMSKMQSGQMRYVDVDAYMQARAKAQKDPAVPPGAMPMWCGNKGKKHKT